MGGQRSISDGWATGRLANDARCRGEPPLFERKDRTFRLLKSCLQAAQQTVFCDVFPISFVLFRMIFVVGYSASLVVVTRKVAAVTELPHKLVKLIAEELQLLHYAPNGLEISVWEPSLGKLGILRLGESSLAVHGEAPGAGLIDLHCFLEMLSKNPSG